MSVNAADSAPRLQQQASWLIRSAGLCQSITLTTILNSFVLVYTTTLSFPKVDYEFGHVYLPAQKVPSLLEGSASLVKDLFQPWFGSPPAHRP